MENKIDFKCVGDNLEEIPESIEIETGLKFPEVHTKGEYMATISKALREYRKDMVCRLPFCNTVEAEAFGASIKLGDSKTGPRVKNYRFNSIEEIEAITAIDLNKGRIKEVLDAADTLSKKGEIVTLNIEGPFTIISSLIDSTTFYKAIRKNRDIVDKVIEIIEESIMEYALEAVKRGVKIISYGDPVGALDLVGPKVFKDISSKSTLRILKGLEEKIDGVLIHVCGKASSALENLEMCSSERIEYDNNLTYAEGMLSVLKERKDCKIIGHACIKRTSLHLKDNAVYKMIIE